MDNLYFMGAWFHRCLYSTTIILKRNMAEAITSKDNCKTHTARETLTFLLVPLDDGTTLHCRRQRRHDNLGSICNSPYHSHNSPESPSPSLITTGCIAAHICTPLTMEYSQLLTQSTCRWHILEEWQWLQMLYMRIHNYQTLTQTQTLLRDI